MFYDVFVEICNKTGISPSAAVEAVGVNRSAVTLWRKGSEPRDSTKRKIANYFGLPFDYFDTVMQNQTEPNETQQNHIQTTSKPCPNDTVETLRDALLPEDEKELLDLYRQMSEMGRAKLMDYANLLLMADVNKKFTVQEVSA